MFLLKISQITEYRQMKLQRVLRKNTFSLVQSELHPRIVTSDVIFVEDRAVDRIESKHCIINFQK